MVHLFEEEKRNEISFDRLYADGKLMNLDEHDFIREDAKKSGDDNELI
jgi:ribosome-associated protein